MLKNVNNYRDLDLYYPNSQKDFYLDILKAYIENENISPMTLRDRIMRNEDTQLRGNWTPQRKNSAPPRADNILNRDHIKNWLNQTPPHRLGDSKFKYVDRFIQSEIPFQLRMSIEKELGESKAKHNLKTVSSIFKSTDCEATRNFSKSISEKIYYGWIFDINRNSWHHSTFNEYLLRINLSWDGCCHATYIINAKKCDANFKKSKDVTEVDFDWKRPEFFHAYLSPYSDIIETHDKEVSLIYSVIGNRLNHRTRTFISGKSPIFNSHLKFVMPRIQDQDLAEQDLKIRFINQDTVQFEGKYKHHCGFVICNNIYADKLFEKFLYKV